MAIWRLVARWISNTTRAQAHARALAPAPTHTLEYNRRNM